MEGDVVDRIELTAAVAAAEERQRFERLQAIRASEEAQEAKAAGTIAAAEARIRRDIKLYLVIGVAAGNAVAAYVSAKYGPQAAPATAHAVRALVSSFPL